MNRILLVLAGSFSLLLSSCSNPSEVQDPEQLIIVQAYLVPGEDTTVKLRRTLPPERFYDGLEDTLGNAEVRIVTEGETFVLSEDPHEKGAYRIAQRVMPVLPGRTYHLTVDYRGRQLRASTIVPEAPQITVVSADTIVYYQHFANLYGELVHPGEFHWTRSAHAAGYIVIVEALEVRSLGSWALPLTGDLDRLLDQREQLEGRVSADSLAALDRRIDELRGFLEENVSLVRDNGDPVRWLRDRDQREWERVDSRSWSEGRKWRERMDRLFFNRMVDYWVPADTLRGDYWWLGVRFEGEYQIRVQAADRNYVDYFVTSANGRSGNDGDRGPLFNVTGGLGVFGAYAEDRFRVLAVRGEDGRSMKISTRRE